jgi:hypothetical protein
VRDYFFALLRARASRYFALGIGFYAGNTMQFSAATA